jgi:subtilisin family serine protease
MRTKLAVFFAASAVTALVLTGSNLAQAAKPDTAPGNSGNGKQGGSLVINTDSNTDKVTGKPVDSGKPVATGDPVGVNKPVETGKPADIGKDFVNAKKDSTGKPVTAEGKATFGNPVKLTGAEKKAAALAKAAEKKENGNKVQYIIRFNESANPGNEISALRSAKASVGKQFSKVFNGVVAGLTDKQRANFAKRGTIASITEDAEVTATETQISPSAWGIDRIDQTGLPLSSSYTYASTGSGVQIYVVDTGIRASHSEFTGRVSAGYSAISDANGTEDCNGHGTHVSSIAAGTNFGVAKAATLIPVRVLGCDGSGSISGVIAGLDWIAGQYVDGTPAVVNMSLGGGASSSLDAAVNSLINRGITVVAAAGNSKVDACTSSPARVAGAITVAATTNTDTFASYSNFGSCVDLAAPGSAINGAWITGDSATAVLSGTSMAAPHVAGVAAVLLASGLQQPNIVSLALTDSATKDAVSSMPAGTVNSLLYANPAGIGIPLAKAPLAPTSVSAVAGKRAATVSWVQADNRLNPLVSQTVKVWAGGNVVGSLRVSAVATSAVLKLRAGVSYTFTVVASNATASSVDSPPSNVVVPTNK